MVKEVAQKSGKNKEDNKISSLNQLIKEAEESFEKLERAYEKQDAENFNRFKATLIQTQRKILENVG